MKIDRSRLEQCTFEVPAESQAFIDKLMSCSRRELLNELEKIDTWPFGKCELFHWIHVLNLFDVILEEACARKPDNSWELACDYLHVYEEKQLLLWVLYFTKLLIKHSFPCHLYDSMEHLATLLSSCDMHVVLTVLDLLYMFSKRSNFITEVNNNARHALLSSLDHLAKSWRGKENGFCLADYCKENPDDSFLVSGTTLNFDYYAQNPTTTSNTQPSTPSSRETSQTNLDRHIQLENVDKLEKTPAQIMKDLLEVYDVPQDRHMALFTGIRLAYSFSDYPRRLQCLQARLQALAVLITSHALQENAHDLLRDLLEDLSGLLKDLLKLLELPHLDLLDVKVAALLVLTRVTRIFKRPDFWTRTELDLRTIIDVTLAPLGNRSIPVLVKKCIKKLTSLKPDKQPLLLPLAMAFFNFLYYLASYEAGGLALVTCGVIEILLKVINLPGSELEHITFVTRAVRVIDLITNIDMQGFQAHGGLGSFINRLDMEVNVCRREQPFEIEPHMYNDLPAIEDNSEASDTSEAGPSGIASETIDEGKTCLPQRAALLKSMLNFLKKAIQDPAFSDSIRHVMEGEFPSSLKHIISNSEYYGQSLFLLAIDVVTVYVFQEPSLLSSLQDNGLTGVVLHAVLSQNSQNTLTVIRFANDVFVALSQNNRGFDALMKLNLQDKLFRAIDLYANSTCKGTASDQVKVNFLLGNYSKIANGLIYRHVPRAIERNSVTIGAVEVLRLPYELCVAIQDASSQPMIDDEQRLRALKTVILEMANWQDRHIADNSDKLCQNLQIEIIIDIKRSTLTFVSKIPINKDSIHRLGSIPKSEDEFENSLEDDVENFELGDLGIFSVFKIAYKWEIFSTGSEGKGFSWASDGYSTMVGTMNPENQAVNMTRFILTLRPAVCSTFLDLAKVQGMIRTLENCLEYDISVKLA